MGEVSEFTFEAQCKIQSLIFFWFWAAARAGRFNSFSPSVFEGVAKSDLIFSGTELHQILGEHRTVIGAS